MFTSYYFKLKIFVGGSALYTKKGKCNKVWVQFLYCFDSVKKKNYVFTHLALLATFDHDFRRLRGHGDFDSYVDPFTKMTSHSPLKIIDTYNYLGNIFDWKIHMSFNNPSKANTVTFVGVIFKTSEVLWLVILTNLAYDLAPWNRKSQKGSDGLRPVKEAWSSGTRWLSAVPIHSGPSPLTILLSLRSDPSPLGVQWLLSQSRWTPVPAKTLSPSFTQYSAYTSIGKT